MQVAGYELDAQPAPTVYFIGVTTGQSSIMSLFPVWAKEVGLADARIVGVDLPLHAAAPRYRQAVAQIKYDPLSLGALVTTHKIDVLRAARDLFDELDPWAQLCDEVSCISKRAGRLMGQAKDPITAGRALQDILTPSHWKISRGQVLCLGAGGAAAAIIAYFLSRPDPADRPDRIIAVDVLESQLDHLRAVIRHLPGTIEVQTVLNTDPRVNDRLMADLPSGSLVINATGLGKDRAGSPITEAGLYPERGVVWELNYRGALDFLKQAKSQQPSRQLSVHDGWHYFCYGWSAVLTEVFHLEFSPERLMAAGV